MNKITKTALVAFLAGALGLGASAVGYHLYVDHQNFHAMLNWVASQAQAQQVTNSAPKEK